MYTYEFTVDKMETAPTKKIVDTPMGVYPRGLGKQSPTFLKVGG